MVLSDEGRPMTAYLRYTPLPSRKRVLDCLMNIHRAGICHGDFDERNIVVRKRLDVDPECPWFPMVIDLGRARDHRCQCIWNEVRAYDYAPSRAVFDCDELWLAFRKAALWQPEFIEVLGRHCPAE
ncbi:hypothetical protein OH76DRAFT_1554306, partial [Lentinus brumalis]